MKLFLARHGSYSSTDTHSALSEQGKLEISRLAHFLSPLKIQVDHIWHSEKVRAKQTAELLAPVFTSKYGLTARACLGPLDDINLIENELMHEDSDVLIVGHLPFLSKLISKLMVNNEDKEIVFFYPSTLACLEKSAASIWTIHWVVSPWLLFKT